MATTVALLVVALAGGCSGSSDRSDGPSGTTTTSSPRSGGTPVIDSEACAEVRSGIDAFNLGDFDETVEHFEEALPLAQKQDDGSTQASQLIEAVRYYAQLDAELYLEASQSSPEFAKYKAITLGQCVSVEGEEPESPGVEV